MTARTFLSFFGPILVTAQLQIWAAEVTFSRDVAPILYRRCVSCHHPNGIAPMFFLTYQDVRPWAAAILRWGQASIREMMNGWIEYIDASAGPVELSKMRASK